MSSSFHLHYKNKYPGGQVQSSSHGIDVYDADGNHAVALRADGAGSLVCQSEALGCSDRHDLAPIPKDARLYKMVDGKIAKDDKFEERSKKLKAFLRGSKIASCFELGLSNFDDKQQLTEQGREKFFPKALAAPMAPAPIVPD